MNKLRVVIEVEGSPQTGNHCTLHFEPRHAEINMVASAAAALLAVLGQHRQDGIAVAGHKILHGALQADEDHRNAAVQGLPETTATILLHVTKKTADPQGPGGTSITILPRNAPSGLVATATACLLEMVAHYGPLGFLGAINEISELAREGRDDARHAADVATDGGLTKWEFFRGIRAAGKG
jgi:hypothetical protein